MQLFLTVSRCASRELLTLCLLGNFACFLSSADFFRNHLFLKKSFRNTIRVLNSLDLDQALSSVQVVCKGCRQTAIVGKELGDKQARLANMLID